jgi:transposase
MTPSNTEAAPMDAKWSIENFPAGRLHAFHYFQGVAKRIRYDNLKSVVVNRIGPNIQFNRRFLDFAAHCLFDPSACNIRSPHEKGSVENAVRYIKNNFLAGRTFGSPTDCNQQAAFPNIKIIAAFDFNFPKNINKSKILDLFDLGFIHYGTLVQIKGDSYQIK